MHPTCLRFRPSLMFLTPRILLLFFHIYYGDAQQQHVISFNMSRSLPLSSSWRYLEENREDYIQRQSLERERVSFRERIKEKMTTMNMKVDEEYDRAKEVKQFDDSKIGVKGLVDSGITTIPRIFVHQPESLPDTKPTTRSKSIHIPTIDLSDTRSTVVDQIRRAASTFGFFQITNHGISEDTLDRTIASIKAFYELPTDTKAQFYHRGIESGVAYSTNVDLYHSKAASWRDTIQIRLGPTKPEYEKIPEICRTAVIDWDKEVGRLGEVLMEFLCEGLGLEKGKLKEMTCLEGKVMVGHYYPYCPQPDLTVGLAWHTDPGVLTVLMQDEVGGLQVKHGEEWVDVKPVPGALVINIGDLLQIMSNEECTSVEHRVLANPFREPRVSIGVFFNPINRESLYGPLPELITPEKPARYRQFTYSEFMRRFFSKELDGKSLTNYYKL